MNQIEINIRVFPVVVHDHRTGGEKSISVPVTKEQLRAAQLVGQSSTELIGRLCERQGCSVLEIRKSERHTISLDLADLLKQDMERQEEKAKLDYLMYGDGGVN